MDFAKISGGVQLKLYTNKPYGDSVSTIKKSDSEYVILMPETSNSMTATPILNPVSDSIRGVSVKTQQYENGAKGYTKITVSTLKPIEIVTQVKPINTSSYQLSEDDYSELLQAARKPKTTATQKPSAKSAKIVQKPAETNKGRVGFSPPRQKAGYTLNATSPKKIKSASRPKTITKPQIAQKPLLKPVESAKTAQQAKPIKTAVVPNQISTAQPTQNAQTAIAPIKTTEMPKQIQPNPAPQPQIPTQTLTPPTFTQKLINVAENPKRLLKYKGFVEKNIYVITGIALLLFLILLSGARRMTKGLQKQKETFSKNLSESPVATTNFMDKINDNMTWKEKYQTYRDAANQPQQPQQTQPDFQPPPSEAAPSPFEATQELNELFEDEEEKNFTQENITTETSTYQEDFEQYIPQRDIIAETEVPQHEISNGEIFGKDKLDELFGADEDVFGEDFSLYETTEENITPTSSFYETPISEIAVATLAKEDEEDVEEIKSEYAIDAKRGFYLVDFKDSSALVGHIEDEVFVLKQFNEKIEGTLQARLDEHKGASANYMTRIGKFKALVEVKPDNMNLLIEL